MLKTQLFAFRGQIQRFPQFEVGTSTISQGLMSRLWVSFWCISGPGFKYFGCARRGLVGFVFGASVV